MMMDPNESLKMRGVNTPMPMRDELPISYESVKEMLECFHKKMHPREYLPEIKKFMSEDGGVVMAHIINGRVNLVAKYDDIVLSLMKENAEWIEGDYIYPYKVIKSSLVEEGFIIMGRRIDNEIESLPYRVLGDPDGEILNKAHQQIIAMGAASYPNPITLGRELYETFNPLNNIIEENKAYSPDPTPSVEELKRAELSDYENRGRKQRKGGNNRKKTKFRRNRRS